MKTRKAVVVLLTVCCLATFFTLQAHAAGPYICTVDEVGPMIPSREFRGLKFI